MGGGVKRDVVYRWTDQRRMARRMVAGLTSRMAGGAGGRGGWLQVGRGRRWPRRISRLKAA